MKKTVLAAAFAVCAATPVFAQNVTPSTQVGVTGGTAYGLAPSDHTRAYAPGQPRVYAPYRSGAQIGFYAQPGQPYAYAGQPYAYAGQPYAYAGQPYAYAGQPYAYAGQPYASVGIGSDVVIADGQIIGRDPDPNVRLQLRREAQLADEQNHGTPYGF